MQKIIIQFLKNLALRLASVICDVEKRIKRSDRPLFLLDDHTEIQICIPRPLGLGDLIMISPLVKMVELKFPSQRILVVTEHAPFIQFERAVFVTTRNLRFVRNRLVIAPVFTFRNMFYIRKARYYCGYFFSHALTANFQFAKETIPHGQHYFHGALPVLKALGIEMDSDLSYPSVRKSPFEKEIPDRYICVAPFSNWSARQYPYEYYKALVEKIIKTLGVSVVLVGGDSCEEKSFNRSIGELDGVTDLTGQASLAQTSWIISRAELYIGNDSGPSHIAYIEAKNAYVIFGSVLPEARLPLNQILRKKVKAVDSRASCNRYPCYDGSGEPFCTNDLRCLYDLAPEDVYEDIVSEFFKRSS